jgi:hypothetical protein
MLNSNILKSQKCVNTINSCVCSIPPLYLSKKHEMLDQRRTKNANSMVSNTCLISDIECLEYFFFSEEKIRHTHYCE